MKYVWAILAIIVEFFIYVMISAAVGWKYGGGGLVTLLLFAIYAATWRAITKKRPPKNSVTINRSAEIEE